MERKKNTIESYAFYLFDHVRLLKPDFGCKSSKMMQWKRIKCPFNAHLKRVHRECIVQPITLRIHEHFQCLNEKVMFYIRIAHNKRLRDVNIVCARLLIRCACCCKNWFVLLLYSTVFGFFSSIFPLFPVKWSCNFGRSRVHCSMFIVNWLCLSVWYLTDFFHAFEPFICSVSSDSAYTEYVLFLVPLYNVYLSQAHLLAVILRLNRSLCILQAILFFSLLIQFQKWSIETSRRFYDSFLSLGPPIQMRRHPQKQRNVFIIMGRLECSARIIKYAGVQLFVTIIIIIKNTYFSCVRCSWFFLFISSLLNSSIVWQYYDTIHSIRSAKQQQQLQQQLPRHQH